jgi:hypothetical protein
MTVLVYQSRFDVPMPPAAVQAPALGVPGFNDPPLRPPASLNAAGMLAAGPALAAPRPSDAQVWRVRGWEVQDPQPPRRMPERAAGLVGGDPGNEAPLFAFRPVGWEVQAVQPPAFQRRQLFPELTWRLDPPALVAVPLNWGFEIAPPPTVRPVQYRAAAWLPGPGVVEAPLFAFRPVGWEVQAVQPPAFQRRQLFPELTWRLDPPALVAVPLNWGFEAVLLPVFTAAWLRAAALFAGSVIDGIGFVPAPLVLTPVDIARPERLLASPGRIRLLPTPGRGRILRP